MTQQEFNRLVTLDIQRLVAKAQAEYEAKMAAEREACAGLAEKRLLIDKSNAKKTGHYYACKSISADIRARGQHD